MAEILVVDDEDGLRSYLAEALELDGHDVDQARDGSDALRMAGRRRFHLVLTDLKMPRMDGMALVRQLREEQPDTEIIVLTAHGSVGNAVEAMKLGAADFLQKPISSPAELRMVVRRALERHQLRAVKESIRPPGDAPKLTWGAASMAPVVDALNKVARTDATVLLVGESGTGKEVAARAVHALSKRRNGPFVAVNCAALSEHLLESELFGHEKGAFTGADRRRRGRIELSEGGTFFLDEVGELKPSLQAKLLRVLQERCFERVGGAQTIAADVRWIAATNRDLHEMMAEGTFRQDLYHRLAVFPVEMPPLRERGADVAPLAETLLRLVAAELGRSGLTLSPEAAKTIQNRRWQGNIRELRNALERAAILSDDDTIGPEHLGDLRPAPNSAVSDGGVMTMEQAEKSAIERALAHADGNRRHAAETLGIGLRTLYDKLKRYQLG